MFGFGNKVEETVMEGEENMEVTKTPFIKTRTGKLVIGGVAAVIAVGGFVATKLLSHGDVEDVTEDAAESFDADLNDGPTE